MEESETPSTLDLEYKRYLQILRPYLGQLIDDDIIAVCNAWIQRLSECSEKEKTMRNKYIFSLCYQLARGTLEYPFLNYPPGGTLPSICESVVSDESSTEVECYVVDADDTRTEVLYNSKHAPLTDTDCLSQSNECRRTKSASQEYDTDIKSSQSNCKRTRKQTVMCYNCPEILNDYIYCDTSEVNEHRAKNLIKNLREIKTQNIMLHNELTALREESAAKHNNYSDEDTNKVDRGTSALLQNNDSTVTLKSLKCKLQEVQESRNNFINKIANLQEIINNLNDLKRHEMEDLEAKHKLEIIKIKTTTKDETKSTYDKKLEDIKQEYELKLESLKNKSSEDMQILSTSKNYDIEEKNKLILAKDAEILKLTNQIEDLKNHLHSVLERFIDKPYNNYSNEDNNIRFKAEQLEKRLSRMEKNKVKCTRMFEAKVAKLQREKHLNECSLQLQMVRQRAQVVNEVTDENQAELATALDKLETKYKEIVANVQSTAIQRRMQDQIALESILQAACGISNDNNNSPGPNGQFPKTMRNQNSSCDGGISPLSRGNKVGNICMGNKSFAEDSVVTGYCLNGERMGELFERVYIPQRDNADAMK